MRTSGWVLAAISRRWLLIGALGFGVAFAGSRDAVAETVVFTSTGMEQSFVVPTGVSRLHLVAIGGAGQVGGYGGRSFGARVSGDLAVTPGQVLYVRVGGNAGSGSPTSGGFNGGGNGGTPNGRGGGGASDIRTIPAAQGGSLQSRLLVAGGAGGSGSLSGGPYMGLGGDAGSAGEAGVGSGGGGGAGAGTTSAGGTAGTNGSLGTAGGAGTLGTGGAGGNGSSEFAQGGGGGGGGYYGGGGGGGTGSGAPGGGGGGSSYLGAGISNGSVTVDGSAVPSITLSGDIELPASQLPSNVFVLGKPKRAANGTAVIPGTFPGAGIATVEDIRIAPAATSSAKPLPLIKSSTTMIAAAGTVKFKIKPTARAKARLNTGHSVKMKVRVTFTPSGGLANSQIKVVRLVKLK